MSDKLGMAVIGCGWIAEQHLAAIRKEQRLEIIATVDINQARAKEAAEKHAARRHYTNWKDAIDDEEIDAVLSADASGPSFEAPEDADGDVVTVTLDTAGTWAFSAAPSAYPVWLIYFAETEIGNYTDDSKLIPEG